MSNPQVRPALSVSINQILYDLRASGSDTIALSLGEAFFNLPKLSFDNVDWERGYHYSDSRGIPELRAAIAQLYADYYGVTLSDHEVLITAGSKIAIFMVIKAIATQGDVVAVFEPAWVSYREQIAIAGATPFFLPFESSFRGRVELPQSTKLVILNNPNNPSGRNYSRDELFRIKDACDRADALLLVDEAYSDFVETGEFFSARRLGTDVIVVNSLSKNLGMSGWRLGYVLASPDLVNQVLTLQQNLITCAPTLLQLYIAKYLKDLLSITNPQIREVVQKRNLVKAYLESHGIRTLDGESTFYLFAKAQDFGCKGNVTDFAIHALLNFGVSIVPGIAYGDSTSDFVRISVGVEPIERIKEGILRLISAGQNVPDRSHLLKKQEETGILSTDWLMW